VESQLAKVSSEWPRKPGLQVNQAISEGVADGLGIGESMGRYLAHLNPEHGKFSVLLQAYLRRIPVTVHVTLGADIVHNHPVCSGSDVGEGTHRDFRLFASLVARLHDGGVYLNCGSAVTLPEVF